jgi:hypothetical protein
VSSCCRWCPGFNGGGGGVGAGGGRTVDTALAPELPGVPGALGCSDRAGRRLGEEGRPGVEGMGTLGTSAPLSRSGNRRGPRGPDSRRENARGHRTSSTGTQGGGAAVPGGRARRGCLPSSDLRPRCRSGRGLKLGPGRSRWPGWWEFLGLPRWGFWVGLALVRAVSQRRAGGLAAWLVGWSRDFLPTQGLRQPHPPPSILGPAGPWRWPRRTSGAPVDGRV